ncbi:hypothetical protein AGMMS50218_02780 [Actinomycetota bacterium]|nr:hypothetical protein AGMMS50218_02780 [Actinomycetota bacterium]
MHGRRAAVRPGPDLQGARRRGASVRWAQGAVAAGLVVGVGAFALLAPSGADIAATAAQQQRERAAAAQEAAALVAHRERAVEIASTVAAQAAAARETALASAVPADQVEPLDAAVAELTSLIATAAAATADPLVGLLTTGGGPTPGPAPTGTTSDAAVAGSVATDAPGSGGSVDPTDPAALLAGPAADAPLAPDRRGDGSDPAAVDLAVDDPATDATGDGSEQPTSGAQEPAPTAPAPTTTATTDPSAAATPAPSPSATGTTSDDGLVVPVTDGPEDTTTAELRAAVARVNELTAQVTAATQTAAEAAAAEAAAQQEAQRVAAEQEALREAQRTSLDSYANGKVPASALCTLTFATDQELRCDAAEALEDLAASYRTEFGTDLVISDSYRSYAEQVACRRAKGSLCATPGTSNHGRGTAVDLGGSAQSFGTDAHDWLLAHAEDYGWTLPTWARITGSKPEAWHWEYVG